MYSGFIIALVGAIGTVIGSVFACFCSVKKGKWWLPQVLIVAFLIYCLIYGFAAQSNAKAYYGPEGMLPVIGLTVVGSVILSLGWLVSWVWLLCRKCWKKAIGSFFLWLVVGSLQTVWLIASLVNDSFQYFFWLPFPSI